MSALPVTDDETMPATQPAPEPSPAPPLARYLVQLLAVAILPLLVVASILIWRQAANQRAESEESLLSTAHAASLAVDRHLASYRLLLEGLAQSELIDRGDLAAMHAYAKRVADAQGAVFVSLFDPSGRHLFNTARPYGEKLGDPFNQPAPSPAPGPPVGDVASLKRVFETGRSTNSDLFFGLTTQRVMFTVDVPVIRDGKVVYALNAAFPPDKLTELLTADPDIRHVRAVVVDRRGFVVGRWRDADKYAGVRMLPDTMALLGRGGDAGSAYTQSLDGEYVFRAYARSPESGWATTVALSAAELRAAEMRTWLIWGSAALLALVLSVVLAARLARGLAQSIGRLAEAAATDATPGDYGLRSRELDRLRTALVKAKGSRAAELRARESALLAEARRVEAEAANREKDRFMAAVVHELRTPLAALTNVATLARVGAVDARAGEILQRQVGQLARLTDDLLEASRINVGKFQLQLAPLDLRAVVTEAVEATSMRRRDGQPTVAIRLPDAPVMVQGDRARLVQVVANLVDNAIKFTPAGGAIDVELALYAGCAVLAVTDSGCGIDPEFLPRVFDRFAQATGLARTGEGLGLGLSVARDLVLAHHGRIEASSDGSGARFTVTLPLAEPGN